MVKSCMRKTIGRILLTKDQLNTFMTETEAAINSRPLVYVIDDVNSANPITPAHFLTMISSTGTPDVSNVSEVDIKSSSKKNTAKKLLEFWKRGQVHLDTVWGLWKNEYLLSLRERYEKYLKSPRVQSKIFPEKDQIVHVKDKVPRGAWKMARIEELITSRDGGIRSAKVLLPSGVTITRPLNLLYPLETAIPEEKLNCTSVDENENRTSEIGDKANRMPIIDDNANRTYEIGDNAKRMSEIDYNSNRTSDENSNCSDVNDNNSNADNGNSKSKRKAGLIAREKLSRLLRNNESD